MLKTEKSREIYSKFGKLNQNRLFCVLFRLASGLVPGAAKNLAVQAVRPLFQATNKHETEQRINQLMFNIKQLQARL